MKKLLCKLFGHKISWFQWDEYHSQGICKRCHREWNRYKIDSGEWAGVVSSNGTT